MKATDRDQAIERLLRRAGSPDAPPSAACPDSETLAALVDTTLTAGARREIEAHVADCQRCQGLTAAMIRADSAATATIHQTGGAAWLTTGARKWLVPAAVGATAVALWVAIPDQRTQPTETADTSTAERQVAAVSPPSTSPETPRTGAPAASTEPRANVNTPGRIAQGRLEKTAPNAAADASAIPAESRASESAAEGLQAEERERAEALPLQERVTVQGESPRTQPSTPSAGARAATLSGQTRAPVAFDVASPNPAIRWRVRPGARVEYSADAGATWTVQQTGASGELTAGSAPAADVCWLAGRAGLVLRTVDGGLQWQRIAFPEMVDLTAITASSALDAVVTLADGRRLRTTDGGRTWTPVGN